MKDKGKFIRQNILPTLAALIWGTAFAAQSVCAQYIPPFVFNALRGIIAFVFLFAFCLIVDGRKKKNGTQTDKTDWKKLILGGLVCGGLLAIASNLQQAGIAGSSAGKAGFITALYMVLVPVFGLFLKKKPSVQVWAGVLLAVAGLYLLCINGEFILESSDIYLLCCAVVFALQLLSTEYFGRFVDGVKLSCAQFLVVAILSGLLSLLTETVSLQGIMECIWPLLYVAVFSSGVAYTLQILSLKGTDTTVVTLLLSLESVFAVLAGAVFLGDRLSLREYLGCVLMLGAVILAQIPVKSLFKSKINND